MIDLNDKVYEFVKNIPQGKVATYGQIALHLGNRNFARAVGNILHSNPDPEHIPCHRVVNAQGKLSRSYAFGGIEAQRRLLASEGVVFKNDYIVDLSASQVFFLKSSEIKCYGKFSSSDNPPFGLSHKSMMLALL